MLPLAPQIKQRLSLRDAARLCSIALPERDGVKFHSPFRPDRHPSCSISRDRLTDWSTGQSFDAIGLFAHARGLGNGEAIRALAGHLGLGFAQPAPERQETPRVHPGTPAQTATLAASRGFSPAGLALASKCGVLSFGEHHGHAAWFLGDAQCGPLQARRLDGEPWPWGGRPKALTLKGRGIHRLIGLPLIGSYPKILLCEGGPDLLAAFSLIQELDLTDWCPLGLLGTSANIPREEARLLAGRHTRIAAHPDAAGRDAAAKWAKQLGGRVAVLDLVQGDLNDFIRLNHRNLNHCTALFL